MVTANRKASSSDAARGSADSRDEILNAAMSLFSSRGFHETSMSEVARRAQVSKALIFWHFKTKDDLFVAVLNKLLEPYVIDFAEEAGELDERAQIRKLVEFYLMFVRENAGSVRFFLAQMLHDQRSSKGLGEQVMGLYLGYRNMLVELIGSAQKKGLCSLSFGAEEAAGFLLSALNGLMIEFLFMGGQGVDPEGALAMVDRWLFSPGTDDASGVPGSTT